jgi:N-hydroxyarylamine O-acetyltransferase
MDTNKYLKRINFTNKVIIDDKTLVQLHENHVLNVPFENLDIHFNRLFDLELDKIFKKVVDNFRGGFCYELNTLFNELLCNIGFKSRIIEARIYDELGNLGPKYDHMAIFVETDKKYLLDVGFGDLFTKPLEIKDGIQSDGKNQFKIESLDEQNFLLSMCSDQTNFNRKYTFNLNVVQTKDFFDICLDKQTNPLSYFVKNTVCTKPTSFGRQTVFNNRLIEKRGNDKIEKLIHNDEQLSEILKTQFNINMT